MAKKDWGLNNMTEQGGQNRKKQGTGQAKKSRIPKRRKKNKPIPNQGTKGKKERAGKDRGGKHGVWEKLKEKILDKQEKKRNFPPTQTIYKKVVLIKVYKVSLTLLVCLESEFKKGDLPLGFCGGRCHDC